ncbi:EamA family transporter [Serratia plymuthica]|uniref:EamA family transporter n=1 Tax=Serratia plymuthica TaxID=82996 RepID=A0A2X4UJM3_SERPL|nr:EamA family transporter [Serratia plymuthica]QPS20826.1 EamA family transporter [Serratia plymuthica]QPS62438.1 EamA family transporter [Serratia plymuthica]RKS65266.1 putative blue pigment (indigoidine) exporter [Serratia plymuthica]SQI40086.1 putative DMT superfamily transporter inner membrane protein [Serratia plymuthica]
MGTSFSLSHWRDVLLTALAPIIWGSTYIVTTQLLPPDRPFTAALIRVLPAGVLLLLFTRRIPAHREIGRLLILSALNIGVFQALLFVAAYRLPGGLAAVLGAIQPLLVMVLLWAVDRHSPNKITLWAALAGVFGMAILLLSPQTIFEPIGIAAALLGAGCMATGVWLTRRWQINMPVMALTGWQLVLGGMMLAPAAWLLDAPLPALTASQYAAYTYLSLAGAFVAYGLWFRGITRLPGVAVASLGLLSPLTAVLLGWVMLSQTLSSTALFGFIIVLISVLVVQRTSVRANENHQLFI